MISIWEKQSFLKSDVLILGAGITGLSTAASLMEKNPKLKITVLERGVIPSGASTKNAGFACFGSISELKNDIEVLGESGMVSLVEKRVQGLQKTQDRLGANAIDLQLKGGYELYFDEATIADEITQINALLSPLFSKPVYRLSNEKITRFGFKGVGQLIENPFEGQLDTGKLISSLWQYCAERGVKIHTGCEVLAIEDESGVTARSQNFDFKADRLAVCTNAFSKKILEEELDLHPGRGLVMCIQPEKPLKVSGTFHYEDGYYYFRDFDGKLLFGGGRNLDKEIESTTGFGINQKIKQKLINDLARIILPDQTYRVESTWSGIMAFGENKSPIVKKVSENITIGVRLGGMGVAIGSLVGDEVAELLLDYAGG